MSGLSSRTRSCCSPSTGCFSSGATGFRFGSGSKGYGRAAATRWGRGLTTASTRFGQRATTATGRVAATTATSRGVRTFAA